MNTQRMVVGCATMTYYCRRYNSSEKIIHTAENGLKCAANLPSSSEGSSENLDRTIQTDRNQFPSIFTKSTPGRWGRVIVEHTQLIPLFTQIYANI